MEKDFIEEQKEKLIHEKEELTKILSSFATQDKTDKDNWNTNYPKMNDDLEEAADEVEELEDLLPAEYALEVKLKNVNIALENIEKGVYGICEECGKEISIDRLKINPSAQKCMDCLEK
jgi:DnaK suppressor protein